MKKKDIIFLLIVLLMGTIGIVSLLYSYIMTIDVMNIEIDIQVSNKIGINVDTDKLWFGALNPGGTAQRSVIKTNDYDFPIIAKIKVSGNVAEYIILKNNMILVEPEEAKEIWVSAKIPKDNIYGNYTGTMRIVLRKA